MSIRRNWLYWAAGLLAMLALVSIAGAVSAALPPQPGTGAAPPPATKASDDGFDRLPPGKQAFSFSTIVHAGWARYQVAPSKPGNSGWLNPLNLLITWGAPAQTSTAASGEPATGMHPTNPLYALVSGNVTIDNTTNGGVTWQNRNPPNASGYGDVVNAWLEPAGANALEVALNPAGDGANYTCGRSSDFGVTWTADAACGTSLSTTFFDDREYLWVDHNPASPFYGRVYLTGALFDSAGSGSFNTVTNRWSSDNGATWNPPSAQPLALVPNNEFALSQNHNEYPSMGISANGTIGYAWHRGACCGSAPTINVPNKVMFARSTDGGVSFPFSNTIVTVPLNQTVPFNSTSPLNVRWSDTPNIAADPVTNGTFYAVWTQYRTASTAASAAIYLSKSVDNGATWSAPVIVYNNPNANIFQGFGWVKVTTDHAVHVTYVSGTTSNTVVAQFYAQSTDGGVTFSAPFQLSATTFGAFGTTTDYEAMDVSGVTGGAGSILAGWAQANHFARMGTFVQGTPTPTVTGTPPSATPTRTVTLTPTATQTPCASAAIVNGGFETGTLAPWVVLGTSPPPVVSNALPHSGTFAALLGTVSGAEPNGDGSIYQTITVPASGGTLSYWWNGGTTDSITFDWQDAYITDTSGNILATIMHNCLVTTGYVNQTFNMAPYAGQTVRVEFLVHQDGFGDDTYMYVDDVQLLTTCSTPVATVTGTPPTATQTQTATLTPVPSATPICPPAIWSAGPVYPIPVLDEAIATQGSTLYSFGGVSANLVIATSYKFDGTTWTPIAPLPSAREKASAVSDGTYLYILGGADNAGAVTTSLYRYDPVANTYTTMAPFTTGTFAQAAATLSGKIYRVAGCTVPCSGLTNTVEAYTIASNSWAAAATYPQALGWLSVVPAGGYLWAVGGNLGTETASTYRYDPVANSWNDAAITDLPATRWGSAATVLNGKLIVAGGYSVGVIVATALSLDLSNPTGAWTPIANMVAARARMDGDRLGSAFYVAGGREPNGAFGGTTDNQRYLDVPCATPTVGPSNTATPPAATATVTAPPTSAATSTATVTATPTSCPVQFVDVPSTNTFYTFIRCLACRGIVGGYPCGGPGEPCPGNYYRPNNNVTRGQVSKIVSESAGFNDVIPSTQQTFEDVAPGSTFALWVERLAGRGIIGGYPCGGPFEPCVAPANRPYFRPGNNVTRGQLSKITSGAAGWTETPTGQTFEDVPVGSTFYLYIERMASRGIITGYPCGGPFEPCVAPANRPYFRPNNNATRGQMAKIAASAFFPNCSTPAAVRPAPNSLTGTVRP